MQYHKNVSTLKFSIPQVMMADLGSELPLPLSGDFRAGADLLVDLWGLRRLTQLLSDAGQQGLLAHEQGRLQFLPQQEVMFGLLHLREWGKNITIINNGDLAVPNLEKAVCKQLLEIV